jgi:hypothetical protein
MKLAWIGFGALACLTGLAYPIVVHSRGSSSVPQGAAQSAESEAAPASFVARGRHEFSNGTIARTTVLVGVIGLSLAGGQQERFVGTVTHLEFEGQAHGDLASMKQVAVASAEEIEVHRALPRPSAEPSATVGPRPIGHWHVKPAGTKTWGQVAGRGDVLVTYTETQE